MFFGNVRIVVKNFGVLLVLLGMLILNIVGKGGLVGVVCVSWKEIVVLKGLVVKWLE